MNTTYLYCLPQACAWTAPEALSVGFNHLHRSDSSSQTPNATSALNLDQRKPTPSYITHYWRTSSNPGLETASGDSVDLSSLETITLLESRTTIEAGTTGLRTWLASFILSQYLIDHPDLVQNNTVLELGSGIGFLGMIIARLQQLGSSDPSSSALWLTDVNEDVLLRCRDNVQLSCNLSSQSSNINYRFLDWCDASDPERISPLKTLLQEEINADLIVGADIIFDPTLIPALVGVLELALQPGRGGRQRTVLIAATVRNQETFSRFLQSVKERHLTAETLDIQEQEAMFIQSVDNVTKENVKILKIILK